MHKYIDQLKAYLSKHFPISQMPDADTLLDFLYCSYVEYNPINNQTIKKIFDDLDPIFGKLAYSDSDLLFHKICTLCQEHEKQAFQEGMYVGAALILELYSIGETSAFC